MDFALLFLLFAPPDSGRVSVRQVAESGRVLEIGVSMSERVSPGVEIAAGSPPILSFRLFEGQSRKRFGGLDLVLDDAGH